MTSVKFIYCDNQIVGFTVCGHSTKNAHDDIGRLVCTAISSAAYMAVNTVTDVVCADADVSVSDGFMSISLKNKIDDAQDILRGFKLHIEGLYDQYKSIIHIESEEK